MPKLRARGRAETRPPSSLGSRPFALREVDFALYRNLAQRYLWSQAVPRRVCPYCHDVLRHRDQHWPPHAGPDFHRHGRRVVSTVVRPVRIVSGEVDEKLVERALDWLCEHWRGDASLPQDRVAILHREDVRKPALTRIG
jgi:hypothetical protein